MYVKLCTHNTHIGLQHISLLFDHYECDFTVNNRKTELLW